MEDAADAAADDDGDAFDALGTMNSRHLSLVALEMCRLRFLT